MQYLTAHCISISPTVLCKIVGVYQIGIHDRVTGKRNMEQVVVMENIFYQRRITRVFDLKGSLRGRFAARGQTSKTDLPEGAPAGTVEKKRSDLWSMDDNRSGDTESAGTQEQSSREATSDEDRPIQRAGPRTLLDGDFLEFTRGRPMPMTDRAKAMFQMSILNVRVMSNTY